MKTQASNIRNLAPGAVKTIIILLMVFAVLVLGLIGMAILQKTGPKADKEAPPAIIPTVKTVTAKLADQQLYVQTQGEIEARMSTQLSSQVMGQTTKVSPKLKAGGVFQKGEVILEIEKADYISALARAESSLADAILALKQEESRAEQALRDWRKLGKGEAPELVARKPQLVSAKARVTASEADVARATRDLARTTLRAPYECRVDQAYVDFGAHIGAGMRIADIYSIDVRELRIPVPLSELAFINDKEIIGAHVDVEARLAGDLKKWVGKVIRNEGKVDRSTMMMYLVVEIASSKTQPLADLPPHGLFVDASIKGRVMRRIVEIPRIALSANNTVLIVDEANRLSVLPVEVARTMKNTALISSGISEGTQVIVSAIETPVSGMKVESESKSNKQD